SPRADYLIGLGGQVADGQLDYRPFLGDVFTRLDQQPALDLGLLQRDLRVRVAELPSVPQPTTPLAVGEYQLYPGGKRWPIEVLRSSISDQQLTADPRTNPLGLFQAKTTIVLGDKVRLSGSIVTQESRDVYIWGKHLEITPPELPALVDETARRRLPAIYGGDEVRVGADASGSIRGVVAAHGRLRVTSREADRQLLIDGPVICQQVEIAASQDFQRASSWWRERHAEYFAKRRRLDERWFPAWLQAGHDVSPKPTLTVRHNRKTNPLGGEVHWQDWSKPIYAPAAEDNGALRWELIEWRDAVELQENRS
ncbi:MAG: hypothetical protein QGG36_13250, partial [Pirellulaceae bacterium]|nr:hypothetical protein [Pirellulaceae bacterium]